MTLLDAIPARHSVRAYTDRPIPPEAAEQLRAELQAGNQAGGLHMQLVTDDPAAFEGLLAHYGKFRGVRHYIALIGPKTPDLEEKLGYYGERAALLTQTLGLNTCWVALTFRKGSVRSRCQTVKVGSVQIRISGTAHGAGRLLIGEDVDDVRTFDGRSHRRA